jgi:quercetin dioxygenase-like cupin family protein
MPGYTHVNLLEVDDQAPAFGIEGLEARFARRALGAERTGATHFRYQPGARTPFGHRHGEQEEIYVLVSGSARLKLDDEIVELKPLDAVRVPGDVVRAFEAGPDGADILAFGEAAGQDDTEMLPGWWSD